MTTKLAKRLKAKVDRLGQRLGDPAHFAADVLGHDLWSIQQEILRSVRDNDQTGVKACHASSKTFTAADAVLWWLCRWDDGLAVTTAPTWTQVEKLLWGEVHKAVEGDACRIPELRAGLLETELKLGPGRYALGLSTNEGVRFQGFHSGHILVVLDEAPGVKGQIWDAIEGIRAGGVVHVLALGNPTIASGPFFDAFGSDRARWARFSIGAFDTPNLAGLDMEALLLMEQEDPDALDETVRSYLITRRWVLDRYRKWGPTHPMFEARVMGLFPKQAEDALYSLTLLELASLRPPVPGVADKVNAGLDVAGPGESETALCVRQGPNVLEQAAWGQRDPRGDVAAALTPYKDRLGVVNVDAVGIGYYMAQHLRDLGFPVREVLAGAAARDTEHYANLKAEAYWAFQQRLAEGDVAGLVDEEALGQLAGIRYKHNARGQVVIESKEDARKRGVESPDRAEAVILAYLAKVGGDAPDWTPSEDQGSRPIAYGVMEQQF